MSVVGLTHDAPLTLATALTVSYAPCVKPRLSTALELAGTNAQFPDRDVPTWIGVFAIPQPARRVKPRAVATESKTAGRFMGGLTSKRYPKDKQRTPLFPDHERGITTVTDALQPKPEIRTSPNLKKKFLDSRFT